jgi:hypothetical protein
MSRDKCGEAVKKVAGTDAVIDLRLLLSQRNAKLNRSSYGSRKNPHTLSRRAWYGLSFWKHKARLQLQLQPLCAACAREGRNTPATHADHKHFFRTYDEFAVGELESLCKRHSDASSSRWRVNSATRSARCSPAVFRFLSDIVQPAVGSSTTAASVTAAFASQPMVRSRRRYSALQRLTSRAGISAHLKCALRAGSPSRMRPGPSQ